MTIWDAPNQQVVRADQSAPWEEGTGGGDMVSPGAMQQANGPNLDELTKDEMLELAKSMGVTPANNAMTKDELRAGIDAKLAGG